MAFQEKKLSLSLHLQPRELKDELFPLITNKVKWIYEHKCIKDIGYIKKIKEINKIKSDEIRYIDVSLYIILEVVAEVYTPKELDTLSMSIKKILPYGLFLEENEKKIKALLREDTNNNRNYNVDDQINVQISAVRFENKGYQALVVRVEE